MSATPEATEEAITRFRLDAIREHIKRIWAAMHANEDRGPTDYPPWDDERKILINIIRRQTEHGGGGNYNEGGSERTLLMWLLGLLASFVVISVVGGVTIFGKVSAIEANQVSQQRQIDALSTTIRRVP